MLRERIRGHDQGFVVIGGRMGGGEQMDVVRALVCVADMLTQAGVASCLSSAGDIEVCEDQDGDVDVVVAIAPGLSAGVAASLREVKSRFDVPAVLIVDDVRQVDVINAIDCNVVAVLARRELTAQRAQAAVRTAVQGGGMLPSFMLGALISHVQHVHEDLLMPQGLHRSGLTSREIEVVRLMAEGLDTVEIATRLRYSERAIKKTVHGMTTRLNLRNRPHAVAYALRNGVI